MKRYAVFPGYVRSSTDGQDHYLNGPRMMRLYGVDPRECIIVRGPLGRVGLELVDSLIELRPRQDGDYSLEHAEARHRAGVKATI